ncbi:MAG: GSCFA domain-containing protein [Paludibacteraceae bacterium]|nr:GSCFA domain-containing protein [Paludibacteraceae bacterium]
MMKLQTIVDIKPSEWKIGYEDKILLVGSCFADSIGQMMAQRELNVTCNPFGTLYNPLSIAQAINAKISKCENEKIPLIYHDGLWHSMAHHGAFSRPTREEAEEAVRQSIQNMQRALEEATVVIITFGTAWVYQMANDQSQITNDKSQISNVVANCHKMPEQWFTRRRLTVDEIVRTWMLITARYPDKHWLFTVSPIRHIRDGLHENQLSKATLLMAVEQLNHAYFPAYEIMLDELRDYRFYADDLVHPSQMAVEYIWERFIEAYCTPQTRNEMTLALKRWKRTQHIPLH